MVKLTQADGNWMVPSQTRDGKRYVVNAQKRTCSCPDHQETGFVCKHIHAVTFVIQREEHTDGTVTETNRLRSPKRNRIRRIGRSTRKPRWSKRTVCKFYSPISAKRFPNPTAGKAHRAGSLLASRTGFSASFSKLTAACPVAVPRAICEMHTKRVICRNRSILQSAVRFCAIRI